MFYLRVALMWLWLPSAFFVGTFRALLHFGDLNVNQWTSKLGGRGVLAIAGIKLQVEGLDEIEKHQPCIYTANHQGSFDIATYGAIFPHHCVVIGKKEVVWIPFVGLYFVAGGNILVNRQKRSSAIQSLSKAVDAIKSRKASIWIFPEGTRNRTSEPMLPFKKGAFHMAIAAQVPVVPVVCAPITPLLSWKEKRVRPGILKMKVLPPVPTAGMTADDVDKLSDQVRNRMVEALRGLST